MSASKRTVLGLLLLLFGGLVAEAAEDLGGHFRAPEEFRQVIDTRCLNCHNRQRIEQAQKRQMVLESLQQRMIDHGAVLSERDKQMLGAFWGSPMKERGAEH
jgi:hypothetical protein